MQRLGVFLLAVVVIAGTAWGWRAYNANVDSASGVGLAGAAGSTLAPPDAEAEPRPLVAIIGDSYTQAGGEDARYPTLLAERFDWDVRVDAIGGTGYVRGVNGLPSIADRSEEFLSRFADPAVIVFAAGLNDPVEADLGSVAADVWETAQNLHPEAQIIVVGPFSPGDPAPGTVENRDELIAAAEAMGLPFVDPIGDRWLTGVPGESGNVLKFLSQDNVHPNVKGVDRIADLLADEIERLAPEVV